VCTPDSCSAEKGPVAVCWDIGSNHTVCVTVGEVMDI